MSAWIRLVVAIVVWAAAVPVVIASPVRAVAMPELHTSLPLGLSDFHQLVLDEAHGRLFLRTTDSILVTDLSGKEVRYLNNVAGNGAMALSEDGATLWVALRESARILRITTADLRKDGTIRLPDDVCPTSVAETNGKLAVGYRCLAEPRYGIGVVDLSDESWTDSTDRDVPILDPMVATSPGAPDLVVSVEPYGDLHRLRAFDITTLDAALVGERNLSEYASTSDLAITPAGDAVVVAMRNPDRFQRFHLPDLSPDRIYHAPDPGAAVAWSSDGKVLVGSTDGFDDLGVFKAAANQPKIVHSATGKAARRGVATDAAGAYVWFVTVTNAGAYWLNVLPGFGWGKCKGHFPNFVGTDGNDEILGTDGDDVVVAGAGNDAIDVGFGDDVVCGQGGDDFVHPGMGDDLVNGGGGRDTVTFAVHSGEVTVDLTDRSAVGGQGTDVVQNIENVVGSRKGDTIIGNGKANVIHGGDGDDVIDGLGKNDTIYGEGWADIIEGGTGNDRIYGGDDNDLLIGEAGNDILVGQNGDDTLAGVAGNDTLKGGAGEDTASFALSPTGVTASLAGKTASGEGNDVLNAIEWIVGTKHDDRLTGNGAPNLIEARGGDDELEGLSNDDLLDGGAGFDALNGGTGDDACYDGESHSSCEFIGTLATLGDLRSVPFAGWAQVFLPRTRVR